MAMATRIARLKPGIFMRPPLRCEIKLTPPASTEKLQSLSHRNNRIEFDDPLASCVDGDKRRMLLVVVVVGRGGDYFGHTDSINDKCNAFFPGNHSRWHSD